jgi:flavorubredoxin
MAPMVHLPEVMFTYDKCDKALYSADAFGSFGAINGNLTDEGINFEFDYLDEARRYYSNIVGKYGLQVQMLFKKLAGLEIKNIYPLHGLIIKDNVSRFFEAYDKWSRYEPEINSVLIAYSSVYGGTENVVNILSGMLADRGIQNIKMYDVSRTHMSYTLSDAFKYSHVVVATTTYNNSIFETMETFLNHLVSHNLQNRKYVLVQNGSWAPVCGNLMKTMLEKIPGTQILDESLCIRSTLKEEQISELDAIADKIVCDIKEKK